MVPAFLFDLSLTLSSHTVHASNAKLLKVPKESWCFCLPCAFAYVFILFDLVGLRGAGTHDLCIFIGEVVILQQVVQQTLSVSDVSDQMLPVDFQQLDEGVRL